MPPKRQAPAASEAPAPKTRQSKLAKEHNISAEDESQIKEAFGLFAVKRKGEKEGVVPIGDVRRAMIALDVTPTAKELKEFISILDPDEEGFAIYSSFIAICALKFHSRVRNSDTRDKEVNDAWELFTQGGGGDKITLATLKRVSNALKEDITDDVLRDMILEANGGAGVGKGVDRDDFEAVMKRSGAIR